MRAFLAVGLALGAASCDLDLGKKKSGDGELAPPVGGYAADIGFRPNKHGFAFKNSGGQYPKTPGIVDTNVVVKMFGKDACVGGNTQKCKLTPPATEWAGMINRAINGGRCEGMAVASLTMFQKIDDPARYGQGATSAHQVNQNAVTPLIAYYWAWQTVDPMQRETAMERRKSTPAVALDRLSTLMKSNQLATIAIWAQRPLRGGHAVTPYAIENKGNDVYWIRIYDNNYPDKERYIVIDRKANTWRYDVAALNPDQPRQPWMGNAETRSIAILPVATRLKRAECPFCKTAGKKTVMARGADLTLTDPEGHKLGYEGDKLVNEIPDADVVDLAAFLEDAQAPEPIFVVPGDRDYDVSIGSSDPKPGDDAEDDDEATSVAIFSGGSALSIGRNKRDKGQRDVLSLSRDGDGIRYKTGNGKVPRLRLSVDDDKEGLVVGIRNIKADADDEVEVNLDRKEGKVHLQGGGKKTESYDLKVRRVRDEGDDDEVEAKGVKFKQGEAHAIDVRSPKKGAKPGAEPVGIQRGKAVARPRPARDDKKAANDPKDDKSPKDPKATKLGKDAKDDKAAPKRPAPEPPKKAPPPAPPKKPALRK